MKIKFIASKEDIESIRQECDSEDDDIVLIIKNDINFNNEEGIFPLDGFNSKNIIIIGRNNKLSGIYINSKDDSVGIFKNVNNLCVKDLIIDNSIVYGNNEVGILAGCVFDKVSLQNMYLNVNTRGNSFVGAAVGMCDNVSVVNLKNHSKVSGKNFCGSIIGFSREYIEENVIDLSVLDTKNQTKKLKIGYCTKKCD